jgi:hypothetical protein
MNKKLIILSCLIIVAFGLQTAFTGYELMNGSNDDFNDGYNDGYNNAYNNGYKIGQKVGSKLAPYIMFPAKFTPGIATSDTLMVYNDKAGARIPVKVAKVSVEMKEIPFPVYYMIPVVLSLPVLIIIACVQFWKLIVSVARSRIFVWSNVKRLRYIGGVLIALFLFEFITGMIFLLRVGEYISLPGYHLDSEINAVLLISGLFFLLIAEIFAKGLRLKEEQELTI